MFLNHYLDIVEAIEEGNLDSLDYSDFTTTDFPQEIPLPSAAYLSTEEHEQIKEWVLAVSMDQNIEQVISFNSYIHAKILYFPPLLFKGNILLGLKKEHKIETSTSRIL